MANQVLAKNYTAGGAIAAFRIVKMGSNDGEVVQAAAATDLLMGVTGELGPASGERVDIIKVGIARIEFGGNVTRGNSLTADASGKAVTAAPGAGVNNRIIGFAEVSGVSGDIGDVFLAPGVMQG